MNSLQIGTSSLTYFYMQPPLQSPSKIHSSSSANFHLFIPCYMFIKPSLWSQLTLPFPIAQQFLSPFSFAQPSLQFLHKKHFPYLSHGSLWKADSVLISAFFLEVWTEKKAHKHWFIFAQVQEIDVLQEIASDGGACNQNGKPSNLSSPIPSLICL